MNSVNRFRRFYRLLSALSLLAAIPMFLTSCARDDYRGDASETKSGSSMKGVRLSEFEKGIRKWSLFAEQGEYSDKHGEIRLKNALIDFFGKGEQYPLHLSASTLDVNSISGNIYFRNGFNGSGENGLKFTAGRAAFSNRSSLLTAENSVTYSDSLMKVTGRSLEIDTSSRKFTLYGGVNAVISKDGKGL